MKIAKVLNNNVVIVHDELAPQLVEKTVALKSRKLSGHLSELLCETNLLMQVIPELYRIDKNRAVNNVISS